MMPDLLTLAVFVVIASAMGLSFALGWVLGQTALAKRFRPSLPSDDASGDCWPHQLEIPVHKGDRTDARA